MTFNISLNKLISNPTASGWVQLHDFTPVNENLASKSGRLITLISTNLPLKEELVIGKEILTRLHEIYYAGNADPFQNIAKAVQGVYETFAPISILCLVCLDSKIIIVGIGDVEFWVNRRGKLAKIVSAGSALQQASGLLEDTDIFFLGTSSFFQKLTPEILKSDISLDSIVNKSNVNVGLGIVKVQKVIEENIPKINNNPKPVEAKRISPIRLGLARLIDQILVILPQKKMYIKEDFKEVQSGKKRKIATSAGAILLVLLIVSIVFGVRQQKISVTQSKYAGILSSVQHNLDEAKSLSSVDPTRARSLVLDANTQIQSLLAQKIKDDRITKLASDVAVAMGQIAGLYNTAPTMYLDLGLLSSGFKGDDLSASDNRMVVLDAAGKRLESIDIDTSKTTPVAGPDIMPNAKYVSAYSDRNFVLAENGIWEIGDKAGVILRPEWGNNVLIESYTGNIYVLDKDNSVVWKYQGDSGNFDAKQNWFGAGVKPDLSSVVSWTIDGNIWMLTTTGDILRFSAGSPEDFSLKDSDKPLKAIDIFTTQDSKYLYILDSGNSRVLVIDKDGNYKAQYVDDNIKSAKKIVVSEPASKMILLEGDKLFSLDIKHL